MTELLQTILLRVTIAGAVSAMALKLAGGGALKEVVRTAAGLLMLLALLQPLAGLHVLSWNWQGSVSQSDIDEMQARNMQTTMSTVAASIAKAMQQRAEEAGIPCTVNVEMANDADGLLQVDKVTVYYDSTAANRLSERYRRPECKRRCGGTDFRTGRRHGGRSQYREPDSRQRL